MSLLGQKKQLFSPHSLLYGESKLQLNGGKKHNAFDSFPFKLSEKIKNTTNHAIPQKCQNYHCYLALQVLYGSLSRMNTIININNIPSLFDIYTHICSVLLSFVFFFKLCLSPVFFLVSTLENKMIPPPESTINLQMSLMNTNTPTQTQIT